MKICLQNELLKCSTMTYFPLEIIKYSLVTWYQTPLRLNTNETFLKAFLRYLKGTQAWIFFVDFFCRNRNHMVPRACNTRFLKIVFDSAEILDFKTFPRMLSMRWNRFHVCSACDEIRSEYAQCAIKFVPRMLSKDCTCKNCSHFTAGWACAEIRSAYAQCAMKSFPRMLSKRML